MEHEISNFFPRIKSLAFVLEFGWDPYQIAAVKEYMLQDTSY